LAPDSNVRKEGKRREEKGRTRAARIRRGSGEKEEKLKS
jgi:hypothetical protein